MAAPKRNNAPKNLKPINIDVVVPGLEFHAKTEGDNLTISMKLNRKTTQSLDQAMQMAAPLFAQVIADMQQPSPKVTKRKS